ncbi:protein translocase subunit SecF [soil metagenome]
MMRSLRKLSSFDNDIDFTSLWRKSLVLSAVLVLVSIGALVFRGVDLGIDFEGGDAYDVPAADVSTGEVRDALAPLGQDGAKVQVIGGDTLRVQTETLEPDQREEVLDALSGLTGTSTDDIGVSTVGPSWGEEISEKALRALVLFLILVAIYITVRLEWQMAVGSLVGLVHDLIISVGVYALFQFEITPATVISFLTILGYSLYDGIVVCDKVQENRARVGVAGRMTYSESMSLSLNQTLMRSLNTSITALLPVLSMLVVGSFILGAVTLKEFAVALAVGLTVGAYSSVFVAAPVVAWIREREPRNRSLRERLEAQRTVDPVSGQPASPERQPVGAAAPAGAGRATTVTTRSPQSPRPARPSTTAIPPRPRKKGRRR